ncbi:alpha/beta fold hydrolase, partial [Faecalibacterium prausnitzii]|uniref:alpha/beta fold hydrolase n=1 Tax=Faecalibacterium prausnitzii TaxID=853 RepID=UPI00210A6F5D
ENVREQLGLDQIHLLGQSWGGMLALIYLCDYQPKGVKSLILSSTLASAKLWSQELHRLIKYLPKGKQAA